MAKIPGLWLLALCSALTSLGISFGTVQWFHHALTFEGEDGYDRLGQIISGLILALLLLIFLSSAVTFYLHRPAFLRARPSKN